MNFEYKPVPVKKRRGSEKKEEDITRRSVLKAGIAGAAFLLGARIFTEDERDSEKVVGEISKLNNPEKILDEMEKAEAEREEARYEEETEEEDMEEIESLTDILDFSKEGEIKLTPEKMEKVKNFWKERYGNKKDNLHKSLIDGYRDWGYWRPYTEHRFESVRIPVKFALLALPESHWKVNAKSKANAVGPYQFTPDTGARFNLKMDNFIDERKDPVKSAEACALVLKELHKASGDWDVAVSGYNGGFAWRFIKEAKEKGQKTDYVNFLGYLEKKLNGIKNDLISDNLKHTVKKRDSLGKIASFYRVNQWELRRVNGMKKETVFVGQKILIPTKGLSHEAKRKIFARTISGFSENLNYPAKFHAIRELVEEGGVREQHNPVRFSEIKIEGARDDLGKTEHIVAKGEWLSLIARNYGIKVTELRRRNRNIKNMNDLKPGSRLMLPVKVRKKRAAFPSLVAEARKRNQPLERIKFLNPKVINAWAPLPSGTVIRV